MTELFDGMTLDDIMLDIEPKLLKIAQLHNTVKHYRANFLLRRYASFAVSDHVALRIRQRRNVKLDPNLWLVYSIHFLWVR